MTTNQEKVAALEKCLEINYDEAVELLQERAKAENDEDGAIIMLCLLDETMLGKAYGKPETWIRMLFGVAKRNQKFATSIMLTAMALQKGIDLETEEQEDEAESERQGNA